MNDDNNPYQSPTEELTPEGEQQVADQIEIFTFKGRIGRLRYLAYAFALNLLVGLVTAAISGISAATGGQELIILVTIASVVFSIVVNLMVTIRRFHDLDITGWAAVAGLIPIVNFFVFLYLVFAPGTQGVNRFGLQPPQNTTGVVIASLIIPVLFVIGILAAIAIPSYVDYTERAQQYEQQRIDQSDAQPQGDDW